MKKKLLSFGFFVIISITTKAQSVIYFDAATSGAVALYAANIKEEQKETNKELNQLQKAQAAVAIQLNYVADLQNKVYKGLSEVNGVVLDAVSLKRTYQNVEKTLKYTEDVIQLGKKHPEYLVFATQNIKAVKEKSLDVYTSITNIITGGSNLMTSGERMILIRDLEKNTYLLYIYILTVKSAIQRAVSVGFWKKLNPFQNYINTDLDLFQNIMRNSGITR